MTSLTTSPVSALTTHPAEVIYGPRPGPSLSPMEVLKILRRRIGWIAAVWLVVSSVTVGGTFLWIKYYPGYRSEAYILVESPQPGAPFEIGATPLHQDLIERFVRDQAVLMKSEQILREALGDPVLRETSWFKSFETPDEALLELRDKLISSPIRGSSYLRVAFTTHNPEDSARIVNAVVDRYWAEVRRRSQERFRDQAGSFSREVDSVKRALDDKVNQIREFQKEAGIPGMTERVTAVAQRLLQATLAVMQAQEQKLEVKAIYESYAALGPDNLPISPDVIAAVELDPRVAGLQNRELGLREELSVQRQKLGDNHQIIKDLQARLQVVQEQLERLRSQRLEDLQRQQVEQARVAYNAAVEKEVRLREELAEAEASQRELDEKLAQYEALREELRMLEQEYQRVQQHLRDLQIVLNTQPGPQISIAARAVPPLQRTSPRWKFNLGLGIPLGLMLGVGLVFLMEFLDTSVRTPRDVVRHAALPLLGAVPVLDDEEIAIDDIEVATRIAPHSMVAECFRQIRTNLFFSSPAESQRTLLITSPSPEDGKTAVAINLAVTVAQSGRRVLLVDANLRRPALHRAFPHASREGLSNILIGQRQLDELISNTDLPQLDVLTAGPIPPNPVELLSSTYMRDLIAETRERYDQVIFDAPPILLVSDPLVLATVVDGTIIVCRAKTNSRGSLLRTRDRLEQVRARALGVILNAVESRPGGYYRRQYRTFYDYLGEGTEQAAPPALPRSSGRAGEQGPAEQSDQPRQPT